MNKGKYVLSQRLYFLNRNDFNYLARKYGGDKYVKQFTCCYNQLCVLMFGQLSNRESLRDVVLATQAHVSKAYHLGFGKHAAESALADANTKQDLCTLPMDIVRKTLVFTPKNAFATFLSKIFCETQRRHYSRSITLVRPRTATPSFSNLTSKVVAAAGKSSHTTRRPATASRMTISRR